MEELLCFSNGGLFFLSELNMLYMKESVMGIHFDNSLDNSRLYTVSRMHPGTDSTQKKGAVEPACFLDLLKKASDSSELPAARPDQSQSALKTQKAVALCQRMELQMNESLLRIVSDTEEENRLENSLMDGLRDILSKGTKAPLLSTIRQAPSEIELPRSQAPVQMAEKTGKIDKDSPGVHGIDEIIRKAAKAFGVDSELIRGVIRAESDFDPNAISSKGAAGLMQLMPDTARELGVTDPFNPAENIMGGTRYLKKLLDRYDGSVPLALSAYNWGMGNLDSRRSRMPAETKDYVAKITGMTLS